MIFFHEKILLLDRQGSILCVYSFTNVSFHISLYSRSAEQTDTLCFDFDS